MIWVSIKGIWVVQVIFLHVRHQLRHKAHVNKQSVMANVMATFVYL